MTGRVRASESPTVLQTSESHEQFSMATLDYQQSTSESQPTAGVTGKKHQDNPSRELEC
jgi:hypothetical protein